MQQSGSVTRWIERLKDGDQAAADAIWSRYFDRLIPAARRKLGPAARKLCDSDDVVLVAFEGLFRQAAQGKCPNLHDRHDLWCLLLKIAEREAIDQVRAQCREKRGKGKVVEESLLGAAHGIDGRLGLDGLPGDAPTPEHVVATMEGCRRLLELLPPDLADLALLRLQGYTNEEIANRIGRSVATVERRLRLIRTYWNRESET